MLMIAVAYGQQIKKNADRKNDKSMKQEAVQVYSMNCTIMVKKILGTQLSTSKKL